MKIKHLYMVSLISLLSSQPLSAFPTFLLLKVVTALAVIPPVINNTLFAEKPAATWEELRSRCWDEFKTNTSHLSTNAGKYYDKLKYETLKLLKKCKDTASLSDSKILDKKEGENDHENKT